MTHLELRTERPAAGGGAVAHDDGGRVVFVDGALPGELVEVVIDEAHDRYAKGHTVSVIEPSADRVTPPCAEVGRGCGGCDQQHASVPAQRAAKLAVIDDSLRRLGRLADPPALSLIELPTTGFRTTIRAGVIRGRAGLRRHHSHDVLDIASCLVAHPLADELIADGRWGDATEITIRVGANTGERMVIVDPAVNADVVAPPGVVVVGTDELDTGHRAWITEEVLGQPWRISARSFFQSRADGAEALVRQVSDAVDRWRPEPGRLVDLCCGVGLFAGLIDASTVIGVESNRSALADARHNLAELGDAVRLVGVAFEKWRPSGADVVVADPPRTGLAKAGVAKVVATGAELVVLVSCDAPALGRDAGLFAAAGYELVEATLVDLFPHTHHVEVVSAFVRR